MSRIDRLAIQGQVLSHLMRCHLIFFRIRSFEPRALQVIKIFTPLTLIVGVNGSGKTTIIECLRFATTGELPPNSATGGAWIHDPKLNGESETVAQVKLSFMTPSGQYMVSSRRLQLTVKKSARSQKTLEGQLTIKSPNGESIGVSTRVAELDSLIPQYLGVSKAILDSVIFCHQDDSLWPMSTPSVLKKKFDDIFEAGKYTKAVDNIKVIRKHKMDQHKVFVTEEAHAKDDKDRGKRAEKKSQDLLDEINELREQHKDLEEKVTEAAKRSEDAFGLAAKFEKLVSELNGKQIQAQTLEQSIKSITMNLREMTETDEELQVMQDQYEEHVFRLVAKKDELAKEWNQYNVDLARNRDGLGKKQTEVGRLENDAQRYERQVEGRKGLIKETAARHKIFDVDPEITEEVVKRFVDDLSRSLREQQLEFNKARQAIQEQVSKVQKRLNELTERKTAFSKDKESSNQTIDSNNNKIRHYQRQMAAIEVDDGNKAVLENRVKELEDQLKSKKNEAQTSNWATTLETMSINLATYSEQKERLELEQGEAAQQAADLGQLDYLSKELKDREKALEANSQSYNDQFQQVFGLDWQLKSLEEQYRAVLEEKSEAVRNAEIHRDRLQRDFEHCQYQRKELSKSLTLKKQKLDQNASTLRDAIEDEPETFPAVLEGLEMNVKIRLDDKAGYGSMNTYYKACSEFAEARNVCKLCERLLKPTEKTRFMERLNKLRDDKAAEQMAEELAEYEKELINLRALGPHYDSWVELSKEVPEEERKLAQKEAERDELVQKLEAAQQEAKDRTSKKGEIEVLAKAVQNIVKCQADIQNYEAQLLELKIKQSTMGACRAPTEIQDDMRKVNFEIKNLSTQREQIRASRERMQSQISALEIQTRDEQVKLTNTIHRLKEKATLEEQVAELKANSELRRTSMKKADIDIQSLLPQISQSQEEISEITQRGATREQELQKDLTRIKDSLNRLELSSKEINEFISKGGPQALARGTREMESIQSEIERLDNQLKQVGRNVNQANEELRNNDDTKRSIADNLAFRSNQRTLSVLKAEISELEKSNSVADKVRHEREGEKWQVERNKLSADQASIMGTLRSKDDHLTSLLAEWQTDYKDSEYKFKEAHIKVEVTKAAIDDLGRYAGALDKAIMKYHSLKMEEINTIIAELWRRTYKGSDVDTIMIKSENENMKGNKSYNYRVVMVKQNAEMDMRGRCSAGQKVLASLIIRLALAECFSVNCGMIALDEPTTNLDRDNIVSLARSLHDLIKMRRRQKNFQLIVITHDEEFLQHMNCGELTDDYFKVKRDERQKSIIKVQRISDMNPS